MSRLPLVVTTAGVASACGGFSGGGAWAPGTGASAAGASAAVAVGLAGTRPARVPGVDWQTNRWASTES